MGQAFGQQAPPFASVPRGARLLLAPAPPPLFQRPQARHCRPSPAKLGSVLTAASLHSMQLLKSRIWKCVAPFSRRASVLLGSAASTCARHGKGAIASIGGECSRRTEHRHGWNGRRRGPWQRWLTLWQCSSASPYRRCLYRACADDREGAAACPRAYCPKDPCTASIFHGCAAAMGGLSNCSGARQSGVKAKHCRPSIVGWLWPATAPSDAQREEHRPPLELGLRYLRSPPVRGLELDGGGWHPRQAGASDSHNG